jgi:hypothetical protein
MKQRRKLLVFLVALVLISVWTVRRRDAYVSADSASEDVESAVKKKKMTQDELDAVIKFIS